MREIIVAALQLALNALDEADNIAAVATLVEQAAAQGAQIVLPPELFAGPYFCAIEDEARFALARHHGRSDTQHDRRPANFA